jgi:hypothetical protein
MERLPYIDEHSIQIGATREQAWNALISVLRTDLGGEGPAALARLLRVDPSRRRGDWRDTLDPDDTLLGFAIDEVTFPERLALCGRHRFSRYALIFELDAPGAKQFETPETGECVLRAQTWAEFPGPTGRIYRALVIGSRGHRLVVGRLLRNVARRA